MKQPVISQHLYNSFKWIKWTLLTLALIGIFVVNYTRWVNLGNDSVRENERFGEMLWDTVAQLVEARGVEALPIQQQEAWETLDLYLVDAKTGEFVTPPRFEPWRSNVIAHQNGQSDIPPTCWTDQFKLAAGGDKGTRQFNDYRELPVISSYGQLNMDGRAVVLLSEMDVAEAQGATLKIYHWFDLFWAILCIFPVMCLIWWVHKHIGRERGENQQTILENEETIRAAEEVIVLNAGLQEELETIRGAFELCKKKYQMLKEGIGSTERIDKETGETVDIDPDIMGTIKIDPKEMEDD